MSENLSTLESARDQRPTADQSVESPPRIEGIYGQPSEVIGRLPEREIEEILLQIARTPGIEGDGILSLRVLDRGSVEVLTSTDSSDVDAISGTLAIIEGGGSYLSLRRQLDGSWQVTSKGYWIG